MVKPASVSLLLSCIVFLSFWIRVQGVEHLPAGQFTETDAYFYYWQASLISEHGKLPARDMHRWLPLGRDLGQTLNLYGYVLAYIHKGVSGVFGRVTLYHVTLYMPAICFCIGLGALCFFLSNTYGLLFSSVVGILLATLPGSIERSTVGFGDRDAWCLMIGLLAVVTYLAALQTETSRKRLIWTLTSGLIVFLGGISWEGFGVFLSVIIVVEVWRFLTTNTDEDIPLYLLWVCCFVPPLYLASLAYRSGYGFAEHIAAFVLAPPVVILAIRVCRYLLITKVDVLRSHARTLSLGFTLACVTLVLGYVFIQQDTFASTTVPLSSNAVMQSMTELRSPYFGYWVARYGTVFIVGSLGFVLLPLFLWKKQGVFLSIPLALFTFFSFFRQPMDILWGESTGNALFGISIAGCAIAFLFVASRRTRVTSTELISIVFTAFFLVWVALSRDAKRYDFFIGISLSYGSAALIQWLSQRMSENLSDLLYVIAGRQHLKTITLKNGVAVILLFCLLCLPIKHAHTYRSVSAAKWMRHAVPGNTAVTETFRWMRSNLPREAIVSAHWRYGSQLNVLAGVKTIIDQDTYLQNWIHLYDKYIIHGKNEREALEFLKSHGATHLMLVGHTPAKHFLGGHLSAAFVPVYPTDAFAEANVNVWQLHYPPDIKMNPKYLKTGFPEIDKDLRLQ